jgi:hypothetical protein
MKWIKENIEFNMKLILLEVDNLPVEVTDKMNLEWNRIKK